MLSVLVGHSYFLNFDAKQRHRAKPYPPLATLQVAAMLRDAGHNVRVFDSMLAEGVEDFDAKLNDSRPQVVVFYEDNYNFLSKMCLGRMRHACCEMIGKARAAGARVIVAGSDASDVPDTYLAAGAHAVLLGEGLAALNALMDRLAANPAISDESLVSGLRSVAAVTDDETVLPAALAPVPAASLPPLPAWDLVDIEAYRRIWIEAHGYFSLNMAASRGCSFRCNWCAKPIWGNRYLQRSARDVAAEMRYLKTEYGADHIWFADDIFGFRSDWVLEFADTLAADSGGTPFTIQLRADLAGPAMAAALKKAGCREVWIGAESGSQKILDAMNKGTRTETIIGARRSLGDVGIRVGFFLMLGYLHETLDDILATRELISLAKPDDVGVSVAYPLPGTKFHEAVQRQLGEKKNWQESNDLEMMFSGTYTTEFYRAVRDLLHEQVEQGVSDSLAGRWNHLIEREEQFRRAPYRGIERSMTAAVRS